MSFKLLLLITFNVITSLGSVLTTNGTVIGIVDEINDVQKFLGIPFAEPPIGRYRLRQAIPLKRSFGTIQANAFGSSCYSADNIRNMSEDCLTLNIWKPLNASPKNGSLPVMVWLYGGGLTAGYSADPRFEGTALTRISKEIGKPIVLVSVNYRLGPFGFLNGKEMAELDLLNLGMLDQRLALHWIQDNIAAFGGDPRKVTLAGQSAGAVSTYSHMMAYGGRDDHLFRGAILQSGGAFPLTGPDTSAFQATFDSLINNSSCVFLANASASAKLDCIRNLPVEVFREKVGKSTGQAIDGDFTRTSIQLALPKGEYLKVPTIVGTNTDVGTTSAPTGINSTEELFDPVSKGFFRPQRLPNETVSRILDLYPTDPRLGCPYNTGLANFSSGALDKMACSIFGDIVQIAPARLIAQSLARNGVPVWKYRFNHLPSNTSDSGRGITTGVEQAYVFSNVMTDNPYDQNLAYQMSASWISFVHNLNPSIEALGLPPWPQYSEQAESMVFNGYGSSIERDTFRINSIQYIMDSVLPDGAA
ncbi:hypothetical protein CKM354_001157500 [Cercospora kikuchii]|uniref:Carboxylic ester hydrolase n=1 Tax=Cercospora kikuchii TaxID=84275 RepID=A0A9P3CTC8_9PEZI|nr:uncharacterized protein CKM354_001157500 [Cercospora kikuchii]GIZ48521.1 hypothetical protein CKM354_001157500 [Cercospora kikuchii]